MASRQAKKEDGTGSSRTESRLGAALRRFRGMDYGHTNRLCMPTARINERKTSTTLQSRSSLGTQTAARLPAILQGSMVEECGQIVGETLTRV
jgi:hypothetical protein